MNGLLKRVFGSKLTDPSAVVSTPPISIEAGQVYSFKTRPYTEFSPSATGRFAAIKILGINDNYVAVAVLDGIWFEPPTFPEVRTTSIINEHRFAHMGRPAVFGVVRERWKPVSDLDEFKFVGTQPVSRVERSFFDAIVRHAPGSRTSTLFAANHAAEGEWRWSNDREDVVIEVEKKNAKNEAERAAKEERYHTRLSKLTWEQLQSETPFERWSSSPPFPPEEFTNAARSVIRNACDALKELGPKPRRTDVRAVLKNVVIWFNEADEKAGGVIETEEREDICAMLEEMAHVARQKVLVEEIDEWREW
ncbi:hypothetical protein NUH86_02795 [Sphingobium sp. JS3065]|uniref:hypothetical protein n=1 Tax=Sphingobium sp. JS3065 TaxID=2970925 RepID=UPI00226463EC|nr:hypothetical protein [Sphingobium sp. JS3065]UZW55748.1 hypothetical protein NUH86_02795 [Sphingobium sp. JS3065]